MQPRASAEGQRSGTVYLIGAGPGDPGLLTVRADRLLRRAVCIVHDYLVSPEVLALAPANAERHYVGKRGGAASISQDEINALLVQLAHRHPHVVRLKGGDPFVFGRGGEEAQTLADHGIPFVVVPGITAGIAAPAYAGIPITHRAASSAVAFATGHREPGKDDDDHWRALAQMETVVLYMGMHRLGDICAALIRHGRDPATPACVVQWGTLARQQVAEGTLADLPIIAHKAGLGAPAITVIGDVVRYRSAIRWFDNRPLSGRTVVVTRARDQVSPLAEALAERGARVIECPLLRIDPPDDVGPLDAVLERLSDWQWIAFTSTNAVRSVFARLDANGRDGRAFGRCRLAAVGQATAAALLAHGLRPDLVGTATGADLAKDVLRASDTPLRVLLPQAANAEPALREALITAGAIVDSVVAYKTTAVPPAVDILAERPDAICFASSGTVDRFVDAFGAATAAALTAAGCTFLAIGPTTANGLARHGLPCAGIAADATVDGLVALAEAVLGT